MKPLLAVMVGLVLAGNAPAAERRAYDMVINNGRVMDPASNFDGVANIGIRDGSIAAITTERLNGHATIDAKGLVVAPGFIDMHVHAQTNEGLDLRALDGVTTALDQEMGAYPIEPFYAAREGKSRINFGVSVGHQGLRVKVKTGLDMRHGATAPATESRAILQRGAEWAESALKGDELAALLKLMDEQIAAGGLGLGLGIEYVPGADQTEIYRLMEHAASLKVPVFTHVRSAARASGGGPLETMQEVVADAAATGASLHICHVASKGLHDTSVILDMLAGAKSRGVDVSTEVYPYTAGSSRIGSSLFNEGWQARWNSDYSDIENPATGQRLTRDTFEQLRRDAPETYIIFHMIPDQALRIALTHPLAAIASDSSPLANGKGHPRGAGTNARVLGKYVREERVIDLMTAIRKMAWLPAQRMAFVPAMRNKGKLQTGMDADITIFDPTTVKDNATYQSPARPSSGILHVLVAGTPVVRDGKLVTAAHPGQGIRLRRAP